MSMSSFKLLRAEQPKQKKSYELQKHRPIRKSVAPGRGHHVIEEREPGWSRAELTARAWSKSSARVAEKGGGARLEGRTYPAPEMRTRNGTQILALQLRANCNLTARIQNSQSPMGSSSVERRRPQPLILPESHPGRQQQFWNRCQAY